MYEFKKGDCFKLADVTHGQFEDIKIKMSSAGYETTDCALQLLVDDGDIYCGIDSGGDFSYFTETEVLYLKINELPISVWLGEDDENGCDSWYDYDKQEATNVPPVGVEVLVLYRDCWEETKIVAHYNNKIVFDSDNFTEWVFDAYSLNQTRRFKPLDWEKNVNQEKEGFIENVLTDLGDFNKNIADTRDVFEHLYNMGYRKVE